MLERVLPTGGIDPERSPKSAWREGGMLIPVVSRPVARMIAEMRSTWARELLGANGNSATASSATF